VDIGFIGVGRMGNPMARHLAGAGHRVAVYDSQPEAVSRLTSLEVVRPARGVADAAEGAGVVFTSLPGPREVEEVVLGPGGLMESMAPGTTYVDLSTNSPVLVRRLATALAVRGIEMLDAPVSGGVEGAEAGTLSVMAGGKRELFDRMQPLLGAIGTKLFYCGEAGAGCVVKLCNNICGAAYGVILGEALTLGVKAGVDLETLTNVIGQSTGSVSRLTGRFPRYLFQRNFTPGFSAALSAKDTRLALDLAAQYNVPMAVGAVVGNELSEALARGWGDLDFDATVRVQEERTGVVLQVASKSP
jgi:3-hydroxyisobutyrate dehydrogenase-like beta-hydroxyacid dehydrogenase